MIELERKGRIPDLSRLTETNILAVGKRVMNAHLQRVTDKLAKRHSRAPGATGAGALARITGGGIKRLQEAKAEQRAGEVVGIIPLAQHMAVHEFGEVIRAKGEGYLTVPLPAALNADGTPKKPSALLWKKARVIESKKGNLLIAVRNGRQWVPLYALKKEVKIPARLGLRTELRKDRPRLMREVRAGIKGLLQA
jgi:hypothetical protein